MNIETLDKTQINEIEPLWTELNSLHYEKSKHFKDHYASFQFAKRIETLLAKDHLAIFVAKEGENLWGYCIATSDKEVGEVDSLYIKPVYRGESLGAHLMETAVSWLNSLNCSHINVSVADGNEDVIPFYEKFGFKKRFQVLQIKNS